MKILEQFADKPTSSIFAAGGGWREILQTHAACTTPRMAGHKVVLCLNDTTELDFNGQTIEGLRPLSYEAQRGMYLHPTYAVSSDREPLGVQDAWMWAREPRGANGKRPGICESIRWTESYERLAERAPSIAHSRLVQVADRESDILALMVRAQELSWPVDLLVRAKHSRVLADGEHLWNSVQAEPVLGHVEFTMAARADKPVRQVRKQLQIKRVEFKNGEKAPIKMTCLVAAETSPPEGIKPVCWRPLTNRSATTLEQAGELIEWYRAGWEIEMLFHVLKNGCKVEELQLAHVDKIERALVLFVIVSWRIARLMRVGRTCQEMPSSPVFDADEIKAVYVMNQQKLPESPPRMSDVIRRIAMLGGFLTRRGDGEPGVKKIWLGLQRVIDFAAGVRFMRSEQNEVSCV